MENIIFAFLFGAAFGGGFVFERTTKQIKRIERVVNITVTRRAAMIEREQY